ncbi:MAG: SH3 domain-containing protein [Bacteroidota bacterium]
MRILLLLPVLMGVLVSCGPATKQPPSEEVALPTTVADRAKMAKLYASYLENLDPRFPTSCVREQGKVNPADEAPTDTAFFVFREQLREIVAQKDAFALIANTSKNVQIGHGEENGIDAFIRQWELDSEAKIPQSPLWLELKNILDLGGTFNGRRDYFEAPYVGGCWSGSYDAFEYGTVTGSGVRLRSGTDLDTRVVKKLSYDVVKYLEETPIELTLGGQTHPWIKVALLDGTEGYLYGKFYSSPVGLRAGFTKDAAGNWQLNVLLSGD